MPNKGACMLSQMGRTRDIAPTAPLPSPKIPIIISNIAK